MYPDIIELALSNEKRELAPRLRLSNAARKPALRVIPREELQKALVDIDGIDLGVWLPEHPDVFVNK